MKIEMGESLAVSWLKHVKKCSIVQSNWKISPTWPIFQKKMLEEIIAYSIFKYTEFLNCNIFKKNSGIDQIITQAEVDVLGINFLEGQNKIYAVDMAFHENGLNYGSKTETIARVCKKIIRTSVCLQAFFEGVCGEIYFTSPKIHKNIYDDLVKAVSIANQIFYEKNLNYSAKLVANEDFKQEILIPVKNISHSIADTSELFMRSLQLYKMFFDIESVDEGISKTCNSFPLNKKEYNTNELKIGQLVQTYMANTLESGNVSPDEIIKLQDVEYSKRTFRISFPVLKSIKNNDDPKKYYKKILEIHGNHYVLCSQWYEKNRNFLLAWLSKYK